LEPHETTCWTVIRDAAEGDREARSQFARRYEPVVRAYFQARWRATWRLQDLDDAVQDVFAESFRPGGLLERLDPDRPGGFRAFLYGAARIVALRAEARPKRSREQPPEAGLDFNQVTDDETRVSVAFDRAWARALLREAAERQARDAVESGDAAVRRVELLHLRFHQDLPIREIARRWGCDVDAVHRDYARARQEFQSALAAVVAFHLPGCSRGEIDRECAGLLALFE
jgi:RNA polymerase sigma-70 factor (ECF subfamily)